MQRDDVVARSEAPLLHRINESVHELLPVPDRSDSTKGQHSGTGQPGRANHLTTDEERFGFGQGSRLSR